MKVLICASECVPFAKTGGLADVVGSLPKALRALDVDVRVIMPKYKLIDYSYIKNMEHVCDFELLLGAERMYCGIDSLTVDGVRFYFVDNLALFSQDMLYTGDEREGVRFVFFCRAVLECLPKIGFIPDVLHLNDWQTGLVSALLCGQYRHRDEYRDVKTVYTIHNLRFQGLFAWEFIKRLTGLDDSWYDPERLEFYGLCSMMKAGIVFSDRVTTVSPTYAEEICSSYMGERLDGLLTKFKDKLSGILNGIDYSLYDPANDPLLPCGYNVRAKSGKRTAKTALQREFGLAQRQDVAVIGFIARLTSQKGLDLISCVLEDIMEQDVQLVFLGMGEKQYEQMLQNAAQRYAGRLAFRAVLSDKLAHLIYAGSDLFLMPSLFEPCGLSQMIAMRYGSIPVVRETGGLKDSVMPYNKYTDMGTGFSFRNYNAHEMLYTIQHAVRYRQSDPPMWGRLMTRAMKTDFSWAESAKSYLGLYESMTSKETVENEI